jgi:hypothetical protein
MHRHYGKEYQSLFGNAFGENTRNQNEDGSLRVLNAARLNDSKLLAILIFSRFLASVRNRYAFIGQGV